MSYKTMHDEDGGHERYFGPDSCPLGGGPSANERRAAEQRAGAQETLYRESARDAGYREGLRCAMILVRSACVACNGSGAVQDPNGSAIECEYCGRPCAAIRKELTS